MLGLLVISEMVRTLCGILVFILAANLSINKLKCAGTRKKRFFRDSPLRIVLYHIYGRLSIATINICIILI